jgi:hypothetical protein
VRRLAEIGQITEARAGITRIVENDPEVPVQELVRDVDLAEARHLWRIGRRNPALTAYAELLGRHPGDQFAAAAGVVDLPEFEPVVLDALLVKSALNTPKEVAAAWRWLPIGNRTARYCDPLVSLLAMVPGIESEARGVPKETLKSTVADGRVVTGREALTAKLVDQIGYVEDAYALARELGKAADAAVVKYRHEVSLFDAFGMASAKTAQPAKVQLDVSSGLLPKLQPGVPYYLPAHYAH